MRSVFSRKFFFEFLTNRKTHVSPRASHATHALLRPNSVLKTHGLQGVPLCSWVSLFLRLCYENMLDAQKIQTIPAMFTITCKIFQGPIAQYVRVTRGQGSKRGKFHFVPNSQPIFTTKKIQNLHQNCSDIPLPSVPSS